MLEWANEIQAVNTWNSVSAEIWSRSVSSELMLVPRDAMKVAALEAGRGTLHIERGVDMAANDQIAAQVVEIW
ncbi:hypothetical protein D3C80_2059420 [compost metagenome]